MSASLIEAMHTAAHGVFKTAGGWLTIAQREGALREAFRAAFGGKLPHQTALGRWLQNHTGQSYGEHEINLVSQFDTHRKCHRYKVETKAAAIVREADEHQTERRRATAESEKEIRATERLLKRHAKEEEKRREEAELEALAASNPSLAVEIVPTPTPEPQEGDVVTDPDGSRYLLGQPRTDEQGRTTRERIPLPEKKPEAPAAPTVTIKQSPALSHGARPSDPPWIQRGEMQARGKAEWDAWQRARVDLNVRMPVDPALVALVADPSRGDNGVRTGSRGEVSTLWNGTLGGL